MFQLDDDFLNDLGVSGLPDDEKRELLQHIYEELELRVGTRLAQGLTEEQMQEFDAILQQDEERIHGWLSTHLPEYEERGDYKQFMNSVNQDAVSASIAALSEYVATKWLEVNRPDYRQVVATVLEEIKQEIIENRTAILS